VDLVMLTAYAVTALVLAGVGVLAVGRRIRM
jgi:hypothetical protein